MFFSSNSTAHPRKGDLVTLYDRPSPLRVEARHKDEIGNVFFDCHDMITGTPAPGLKAELLQWWPIPGEIVGIHAARYFNHLTGITNPGTKERLRATAEYEDISSWLYSEMLLTGTRGQGLQQQGRITAAKRDMWVPVTCLYVVTQDGIRKSRKQKLEQEKAA